MTEVTRRFDFEEPPESTGLGPYVVKILEAIRSRPSWLPMPLEKSPVERQLSRSNYPDMQWIRGRDEEKYNRPGGGFGKPWGDMLQQFDDKRAEIEGEYRRQLILRALRGMQPAPEEVRRLGGPRYGPIFHPESVDEQKRRYDDERGRDTIIDEEKSQAHRQIDPNFREKDTLGPRPSWSKPSISDESPDPVDQFLELVQPAEAQQ